MDQKMKIKGVMECWSFGACRMLTPSSHVPPLHDSNTPTPQLLIMETILFLAHTETDGTLAKPALEALGAAKALNTTLTGSTLVVGLIGGNTQPAANQIAACGAATFLAVTGADFAASRYASDAAAAEALCKAARASVVIAAGTARFNRCLPGVAQRLNGRADTHVSGLSAADGRVAINRWYYRQRMEGTLTRTQRPWVVLVDPGSQPAWSGAAGAATIEAVAVTLPRFGQAHHGHRFP